MVTAASPAVEEAEVTVKADEESALGLQKKNIHRTNAFNENGHPFF